MRRQDAARVLSEEAAAGRLGVEAVGAVLAVAGHQALRFARRPD